MKNKKLLVVILLSLSFCLVVSGVGYGEIPEWMNIAEATYMRVSLLEARVGYMMRNPTSFLTVNFRYHPPGVLALNFPVSYANAEGKIYVLIHDIRDRFSELSGIALLNMFKRTLETLYSFIRVEATDMDDDIIAALYTEEEIPLAYFYQGKYHLWDE
ncbi:hypothetical protein LCGC14_2139540 [marine sediment metagenome]|uniref:Uncharacterized protein n=1 Tax=marine sediment metagenome TaxID=412755 RepID=A0A0F9GBY1_9ZZZZ